MYYKKIYYKIYQEYSVNNFGKLENINENKKKIMTRPCISYLFQMVTQKLKLVLLINALRHFRDI